MEERAIRRDDAAYGNARPYMGVRRHHDIQNAGELGRGLDLRIQALFRLRIERFIEEKTNRHLHALVERVVALAAWFTLIFKTHTALYRPEAGTR